MQTLLAFVHIGIALVLIFFVLLQDSKGGAAGVFGGGGGGGSNTLFGATGAANFLVKATRWVAILFAATCIGLTYMTSKRSSVLDQYVPPAATDSAIDSAPGVPGQDVSPEGETAPDAATEN